jgi:hypothetical protein
MSRIDAPWTADQVARLSAYQRSGVGHPFTGERGPSGEETVLIATEAGWVERDGGPVVQTWCWDWMARDGYGLPCDACGRVRPYCDAEGEVHTKSCSMCGHEIPCKRQDGKPRRGSARTLPDDLPSMLAAMDAGPFVPPPFSPEFIRDLRKAADQFPPAKPPSETELKADRERQLARKAACRCPCHNRRYRVMHCFPCCYLSSPAPVASP